jgi:hypothetical protein
MSDRNQFSYSIVKMSQRRRKIMYNNILLAVYNVFVYFQQRKKSREMTKTANKDKDKISVFFT